MSREALVRLIRVATIIAADAKNPDNRARAQEILALADILTRDRTRGTHDDDRRDVHPGV
jgi:hypothetical protein